MTMPSASSGEPAAATDVGWRLVERLSQLADCYDAFILDLWGVVHNGVRAYPGVIDCLETLHRLGKPVCMLSNAPRRAAGVAAKLDGMEIRPPLYRAIVTSGDAARQALLAPPDDWHRALGSRVFHIGPERDLDVLEGLDHLERLDWAEGADFVLNTGPVDFSDTLDTYREALEASAARRLPMVCANPDLVVPVGDRLVICAGTLAEHYRRLGGDVRYHGKPYLSVYQECFRVLDGIAPDRILAVGDGPHTDIPGAAAAGLDSVLITGGILQDRLGTPWGARPEPHRLLSVLSEFDAAPTWVMPGLRW